MKQQNLKNRTVQRALAGLMTIAVTTTGLAVSGTGTALAQNGECATFSTSNEGNGEGTLSLREDRSYRSGETITLVGTGFAERSEAGSLAFKINDGAIAFTPEQEGSDAAEVDEGGTAYVDNPVAADGSFEISLNLPDLTRDGRYNIRLLAGSDGGAGASKSVYFQVANDTVGENCATLPGTDGEAGGTGTGNTITVGEATTSGSGEVNLALDLQGYTPGATVTATLADRAVEFSAGRSTAESVEISADGTLSATAVLPAGTALAGTHLLQISSSAAADETREVEVETTAGLDLSDASLNATTTATVVNAPAGAEIAGIRAGEHNFLTAGATVGPAGTVEIADLRLAGPASLINAPVSLTYLLNGTPTTVETGLKIAPDNTSHNAGDFAITKVEIANGQYQTAVNQAENTLFAASAVGRPPILQSKLTKLDATTLEVLAEVTPGAVDPADESRGVYGVYGIGLDNELGYVWVTNTRQNTVAVYRQSDLSLVKQFEAGAVAHSRDVVVDPQTNLAYVSSASRGDADVSVIEVFDGNTLEQVDAITVSDAAHPFGVTMSLTFDEQTGELFTTSMANPTAAKIDVREGNRVTFYDLGGNVESASGVAWDSANRNLYVANQGTNNVVVVDVDENKVIKDIPTGAGALNAVYDPVHALVYIANRGGATATVIDAETLEVVANLEAGTNANHVSVGAQGAVYLVNKAGHERADGTRHDDLYRYQPTAAPGGDEAPGTPAEPTTGSSIGEKTTPLGGLLAVLGLTGAAAGIFGALLNGGVIKADTLPTWLRSALNL